MKPLLGITSLRDPVAAAARPGRGGELRPRAALGPGAVCPRLPRAANCPRGHTVQGSRRFYLQIPFVLLPSLFGTVLEGTFPGPKPPKKYTFPFLYSSSNELADKKGVSSGASASESSALSSGMGERRCCGPGASVGAQVGRSSPGPGAQELLGVFSHCPEYLNRAGQQILAQITRKISLCVVHCTPKIVL